MEQGAKGKSKKTKRNSMIKKVIEFAPSAMLFALGFLGAMLLPLCLPAQAQQPTKVYRIGVLSAGSGLGASDKMFQRDMRKLGYIEGQNVQFEMRFADGKLERMPEH